MAAVLDTTPDLADADEAAITKKIQRLSTASLRRVIEPETDLPGTVGEGQLVPDELLSVYGLRCFDTLSAEQKAQLSREELASIADMGVRFEAVLMAGFSLQIATGRNLRDPRNVYALHEVGEETRHSRLFLKLIDQIGPTATNPLDKPLFNRLQAFGMRNIIRREALLYVLVLGGEEIPDLLQKRTVEHEETDAFVREVNRYHRAEEARHLAYARVTLAEHWANAGVTDRVAVRRVAPRLIMDMFNMLIHPGVYESVGLPGWDTWKEVRRSPARVALRHEACRPILRELVGNGILRKGRIPKAWRDLCGVDRHGEPVAAA